MNNFRNLFGIAIVLLGASVARGSGILAPTDRTLPPLRVEDHLVDVSIQDGVALTKLTQTFRNDSKQRLEATYIFPLPEDADLTNFRLSFNGKMVKGEVLPADQARGIYESIVRQAKDPGLIEFIGRRLLQMRVFPIEPESTTTIEVSYQQICRPINNMMGYHYPLRTRKAAGQAYGTVRFSVQLHTSAPLKNIWSPTHAVEIVRDGEYTAKIAYEASGGSLQDDFMLLYATDSTDLGMSVVGHKPNKDQPGHFVLMLTPKQMWPEDEYQPQDVVFVIDTSGSMAGEKLNQAKSALRFCIDKLDKRDRFSVVRFSTGFDVLFDALQPASNENKAAARTRVDAYNAAGGTNIADTLQHVVGMRAKGAGGDERPFVVVFLTDGMGNRDPNEIMKRLARDTQTRIFPFGIGHDVNTKLLDQLSNAFTGRPTYVQPGENLELVLSDFFSVISRPVLTNLRLVLPNVDATEQFPPVLGELYHGQQLIVAARFGQSASGPVKLTASRNGKDVEFVWPAVSFANTAEATYVPAVWAGRKISYLVDQIRLHGETKEMVNEIIELSQAHGIQTPYTSWLVAPEQMQRRAIRLGQASETDYTTRFGSSRTNQWRLLRSRGVTTNAPARPSAGSGDGFMGLTVDESDRFFYAAQSFHEMESGEVAVKLARMNADLKQAATMDAGRFDRSLLAVQNHGGRSYNRIGPFLIDQIVDAETGITVLKFGSDAYFDLVMGRKDLRAVLSASRNVVVLVAEGQALLIADEDGIEEFSDAQREQFGLGDG